MRMAKGKVGIVGLGIMGGAFAANLVKAGWRVVGYDIDPARCRALARAGVEIAADAGALMAAAPTIITSLPKPAALEATVNAIVAARARPRVVVEMSTFALADKLRAAQALRRAGHTLLDCPVSGTGAQAKVKDLVVYASGDRKAIRKLAPMFAAFSRAAHDLGRFGNGSRMKYVANLLVAINNVAAAEAMVLGLKAGLDPRTVFDMVTTGAGNSRVFELRAPMMAANTYLPATMRSTTWKKDLTVIGEFASDVGCPAPLFGLATTLHAAALAMGHGEEDTAAVCAALEKMAGVERK
jgi:3-hydroxyisobutyrate dehydrogenase-like beta-hydroxyacid dehydrogenase